MCGIAGLIGIGATDVATARVSRALAALEHRGPDGCGLFVQRSCDPLAEIEVNGARRRLSAPGMRSTRNAVVIGHRRLSIIDSSLAAGQPMATDDGRYVLAYNGEIYNYIELRSTLETIGERFQTRSDTEVLLKGFARWGFDVLNRAEGMFAFVLIDRLAGTAVLARDCFGMKPLYYALNGGELAFASELGELRSLTGTIATADPEGMLHYLAYGISDHRNDTMFAGIKQLPPAHYIQISLDDVRLAEPVRYWKPDVTRYDDRPRAELARALRDLFLESVALHLRSDVPVGALLSGGLDSSAIVMAMREIGGATLDLHTFSYIPEPGTLSEEPWMDRVNSAANAIAHKVHLPLAEWESRIRDLQQRQGEPFGSIAIAAQQALFRQAAQLGVRVVLDGQGSDELFAGYGHARSRRLASHFRRGEFAAAARFLRVFGETHGRASAARLLRDAGVLLAPRWVAGPARRLRHRRNRNDVVNRAWFSERNAEPRATANRSAHLLRDHLLQGVQVTSLPALLRFADRNAMTYSVENRLPFVTRKLAEFSFTLPDRFLVDDAGGGKSLLREAVRGLVPDAVIDRRDKVGLAVPVADWLLRSGEVRRYLDQAAELPCVDRSALQSRIASANTSQGRTPENVMMLWRVAGLAQWVELCGVSLK